MITESSRPVSSDTIEKLGSDGRLALSGWLLNQLDLSGFAWRTKNVFSALDIININI